MRPGARVGRYLVAAKIGAGGMGEVWRGRDEELQRDVAIKVLPEGLAADPERLHRFLREARALAAITHPNIVEIFDIGTHDGAPYMVEELLEGRSLRTRLAGGALGTDEAAAIGAQIAHGLAAAHQRHIVHRDLKPENIFVTRQGAVKILDFGLATVAPPPSDALADTVTSEPTATTEPGRVLGTVAYMAPEQARGQPADHRADIFAFGVVLYELLAGRRPFGGQTASDVVASLLKEAAPPLPATVPSHLRNIVARCLEKRPEDRFASAHDLALVLHPPQSRDGMPTPDPAPSRRQAAGRKGMAWAGAALALVAVSAATAWRLSQRGGDPQPRYQPRRLTSAPGWEAEPSLSPDGTLIAYASDESGSPDIRLIDAHGGVSVALTDDPAVDRHPSWFPDGTSLAFVSDRGGEPAIWRLPRLGGAPVLIIPDGVDPAVSPDGTRVAFARRGPSGKLRIAVAPVGDPAAARVLTGDGDGLADHRHPAWSPDCRTVCYADFRNLRLVSAAGGASRALTGDSASDREPAWSADGKWITFASMREGTLALWRVASGGGVPERLTLGTGPECMPALASDSSRVAYSTFDRQHDIVVRDRSTGKEVALVSSSTEGSPAVAPDGGCVVFSSNRMGKFDLWRQALADCSPRGGPLRLTDHPGSAATAAFSPDGKWLAYLRGSSGQRDIWVMPMDGGLPMQFTESSGIDAQPAFSPNGSSLAFISDRDGLEHVWVCAIREGRRAGTEWQLTRGDASDSFPVWSPGGALVAFVRGGDVWEVPASAGSEPRRVTSGGWAKLARWERSAGELLVSGAPQRRGTELFVVAMRSGDARPLEPPVVLGDATSSGLFGLSADGNVLVYLRTTTVGDLWVMEVSSGSRRATTDP
jgi:Tol biopolymer transport system component